MNKEKISKEIHHFMNDLPYEGGYPSDWQDRLADHLYNQFRQAAVTTSLPPDPWPLPDVLNKLAEAANILLHKHSYDGHGYEEISHCVNRAKELVTILRGGNAG